MCVKTAEVRVKIVSRRISRISLRSNHSKVAHCKDVAEITLYEEAGRRGRVGFGPRSQAR